MADTMTAAKNKIQEKAQEMGTSFSEAVTNAGEGIKNAAGYAVDQANQAVNAASKNVASAGSYLDKQAEDATCALGGSLKAAGEAVRQNTPHDGRIGQASSVVAQALTDTGDYVQREGLEGMACDVTSLIKRNPIPAMLIGIGLGFLVARASTSRN